MSPKKTKEPSAPARSGAEARDADTLLFEPLRLRGLTSRRDWPRGAGESELAVRRANEAVAAPRLRGLAPEAGWWLDRRADILAACIELT